MPKDSFYQRLRFYVWLSNREGERLNEFSEYSSTTASTFTRWKKEFEPELFLEIIDNQEQAKTLKKRILRVIEGEALDGNINAAKLIFQELDLDPGERQFDGVTTDQALQLVRQVLLNEKRKSD